MDCIITCTNATSLFIISLSIGDCLGKALSGQSPVWAKPCLGKAQTPLPLLLAQVNQRDSIRKDICSLCGQCFKQHSQTSFNSLSDLIPPGIFQSFFKLPLLVMTIYELHNCLRKCYFIIQYFIIHRRLFWAKPNPPFLRFWVTSIIGIVLERISVVSMVNAFSSIHKQASTH
jgi:hypothetical protein